MGVKKKQAGPNILTDENKAKLCVAVRKLLDLKTDQIHDSIEECEERKLTVTFKMELDASESLPRIDVGIRFTTGTVTDHVSLECEDPNQTTLTIFTSEELAQRAAESKEEAEKADKAAEKAAKKAGSKKEKPTPEEGADD